MGEEFGGLLDLRVAFRLHFFAGGQAGYQTDELDLDSQLQVVLVCAPIFIGRADSLPAQENLEVYQHAVVRFRRRVGPSMQRQVIRGKVGKDSCLIQEGQPGIERLGG